jgi:hypothetical protein
MDELELAPERSLSRFERAILSGRINAINPVLASRLQRDDLSGSSAPVVMDPYTNPQNTVGVSGQLAAGLTLDSGRISVLMIGILVAAGAGFYIWTRRFQS